MQIHFYIPEQASAGNRLKSVLLDFAQRCPFTKHTSPDTFGSVLLEPYNDTAIAVIMVANEDELRLLAQSKNAWQRFKTILVLPQGDARLNEICHQLRPIYITDMGSDFKEVADILTHLSPKNSILN